MGDARETVTGIVSLNVTGIVSLNVGGVRYTTTTDTLTGCPYFRSLLSGRFNVATDNEGHIFVDRDGLRFRYILNYLRDASLHMTASDPQTARLMYQEILDEASFYGIESLCKELQERINAIPPPELANLDQENVINQVLGKVEQLLHRQHQVKRTPRSSIKRQHRGRSYHQTAPSPEAQEALHSFNLNLSF